MRLIDKSRATAESIVLKVNLGSFQGKHFCSCCSLTHVDRKYEYILKGDMSMFWPRETTLGRTWFMVKCIMADANILFSEIHFSLADVPIATNKLPAVKRIH